MHGTHFPAATWVREPQYFRAVAVPALFLAAAALPLKIPTPDEAALITPRATVR